MTYDVVLWKTSKYIHNIYSEKLKASLVYIGPLRNFVNLRELELPVNGLRDLQVHHEDFPNLQVYFFGLWIVEEMFLDLPRYANYRL